MKNKKGFSLVELVAVVVLLAIVAGIGISVFIGVRKNILEKQFANVKSRIESAAVEYAHDTQIITVSVGRLIEEGYLTADDQDAIYNPVDNSNLNCKIVEVMLKDGVYTAKLTNNGSLDEDGVCSDYDINVASLIKISCYSENNDENDLAKCEDTYKNSNYLWFSGSVKLTVDEQVTKKITDYRWQGLTGESSDEEEIVVTAEGVKSTTFNLSVTYEDGTSETSSIFVRIDNQKPFIIDVVNDDSWSSDKKEVVINASDNSGSGISGYYIGVDKDCNGDYVSDKNIKLDMGKYYVCAKDNAGNVSSSKEFEVINIDKNKPEIKTVNNKYYVTESEKLNGKYYSELLRKVVYEDNESGIKAIKYCFTQAESCVPSKNATVKSGTEAEAIISYPANKDKTRLCTLAIDNVSNESEVYCDDDFLVDTTAPEKVNLQHDEDKSNFVNISAVDNESGIEKIVCRYGTSSTNLNLSVDAVDGACNLGVLFSGVTYYVVADAYNGAGLVTRSKTINFKAEVTMKDAYNEICKGEEYCSSPLYISYNRYVFVVYRNNGGYKAIYDGIYTNSYFRSYSCCNQGYCNYDGTNFVTGEIFSSALSPFLSSLSNYSSKLVLTNWNTGMYTNVKGRRSTAYVGLLDYDEYTNTKSKIWMYSKASGSYFWLASPYSYKNGSYANVMAVRYNGSFSESGYTINTSLGVRPVIVLKGSIVFTSGDGSSSNPYVV